MNKPYRFLLETVLFILLVLSFGTYRGNPAFIGDAAHPFYLIVLLVSVRYGYLKGILSTIVLTCTYLAFFFFTDHTALSGAHLWKTIQQPLFFFAFAMFVGLLVEIDKKKLQQSKQLISEFKEKIDDRTTEIKGILSVNENISHQLSTADQTFNLVFYKTKKMFDDDIKVIYRTVYELLISTVKATAADLFLLEGNRFKLVFPAGETASAEALIKSNRESIEKIKNTRSYFRIDDTPFPSESTPIFMGPILHEESNSLYGLLVVKEIDFINYNESSYLTFKNLCKWLGTILYFRARQNESVSPSPLQTFNYLIAYGAPRVMIQKKVIDSFDTHEKN